MILSRERNFLHSSHSYTVSSLFYSFSGLILFWVRFSLFLTVTVNEMFQYNMSLKYFNSTLHCYLLEFVPEKGVTNITMNFGPQHPAAHGVLRLVLELNGEVSLDV